jgi:hypothetical protein
MLYVKLNDETFNDPGSGSLFETAVLLRLTERLRPNWTPKVHHFPRALFTELL